MEKNLALLADKIGIAQHFSDAGMQRREYDVSEDIIKFFCTQFGYKVQNEEEIVESLTKFDDRRWKKTLENIIIFRAGKAVFTAVLTENQLNNPMTVFMSPENSNATQNIPYECAVSDENKKIRNQIYHKVTFKLNQYLPYGYYQMELHCGKEIFKTLAAFVPDKCYTTPTVESGKLWGYSLQLYALKSRHNWGVGDFTDLKNFVGICGRSGADVIGLNPLNVLFHDFPENASPYSSISRLFLNPIYIDVTAVPGFSMDIVENLADRIKAAKSTELIDYTQIYQLKIEVLEKLFANLNHHPDFARAFENFKKIKGWDLDMLATYQTLYHQQCHTVWGGWQAWEKDLQNPNSLKVSQFKEQNQNQIEFFKFLQFEADRQLKEVYEEVKKQKLKIGLYRDLPVGVCKDSAEVWADPNVFIKKSGAGAPPDAFFQHGQKWCLGAFDPFELKNRAYAPYLKILRANMAYSGALRIDHVMGLMRLFMIPDCKQEGTYIHYNFDDMLGLLALESHLHNCVIVGESIGNVPEGFMDKLRAYQIYSISVLWAERWNGGYGDFKMPRDYPVDAFVSVGTHDMPPLKMWWFGYEIELSRALNMINDAERQSQYKNREKDRSMLLSALDYNQMWAPDKQRQGDYLYGEGYPEGMVEAVHKLIAHAPSKVVMLQPEDIFEVDKLQNLPGTDRDVYPNWRRRLPIDLEDIEASEAFQRNIAAVKAAR